MTDTSGTQAAPSSSTAGTYYLITAETVEQITNGPLPLHVGLLIVVIYDLYGYHDNVIMQTTSVRNFMRLCS
jgi:hypothetical protein